MLENPVRTTTAEVMKNARQVSINMDAVQALVTKWVKDNVQVPGWDSSIHLTTIDEKLLLTYLIVLDSLNFCFWSPDRKWEFELNGLKYSGYRALAAALKKFFDDNPEKANFKYFETISLDDFFKIFNGGAELILKTKRLDILRSVSFVMNKYYDGDPRRFIEETRGLVSETTWNIACNLFSFYDTSFYDSNPVYFLKRAQILVADIYGAFGGKSFGAFDDMEWLTAFADYKVPQILRHHGILEYSPDLLFTVDTKLLIEPDSEKEVELRSATIQAVELLKYELQKLGRELKSFEIDWILWNESKNIVMKNPHHLTKTYFY